MVDGQPRYVTAVSQSDVVDGWRDRRGNGGCVTDVQSNEAMLTGLSIHTRRVGIRASCGCSTLALGNLAMWTLAR